jgi:hypothetical protein
MGIPLLFSSGERIRRTGKSLEARCGACKKVVKMYEAVRHSNVSAYAVISLWDSEERVIQCGECLGIHADEAADELRRGNSQSPARAAKPKPAIDDAQIDAELAALKKRLGK